MEEEAEHGVREEEEGVSITTLLQPVIWEDDGYVPGASFFWYDEFWEQVHEEPRESINRRIREHHTEDASGALPVRAEVTGKGSITDAKGKGSITNAKGKGSNIPQLDDEDEGDEFKPLFDNSETLGPAPTLLSDDSDEDDLVITSGPLQLRPKVSPAKEPPTPMPSKDPAPNVILEDDDDESWMIPAPSKLPSTLPGLGGHTLQALRLRRKELMMLQESSTPEAMTRVEDQARMQAQKRPEVLQSPLVLNTPNSSKVHGNSPLNEAEEKEKILIKVQSKDGVIQSIRIFTTDTFERLFRVYAEVSHLSLANLSFRFNGEPIAPNSTPKYHSMEDGELIEVYNKI